MFNYMSFHHESIWDEGEVDSHLVPEIRFFDSFPHNPPNINIVDCGYIYDVFRSMNFNT